MHKLFYLGALAGLMFLTACPQRDKTDPAPTKADVRERVAAVEDNTGLPMRIVLPEGALGEEELDLLVPRQDLQSLSWNTRFMYKRGFKQAVAEFDAQLKPLKFARIVGESLDREVNFGPDSTGKPTQAMGSKAWISEDRLIIMFLRYAFKRGADGAEDQEEYELHVIKNQQPNPVNEPNKIVPIQ
jgi:hypothetical protein